MLLLAKDKCSCFFCSLPVWLLPCFLFLPCFFMHGVEWMDELHACIHFGPGFALCASDKGCHLKLQAVAVPVVAVVAVVALVVQDAGILN